MSFACYIYIEYLVDLNLVDDNRLVWMVGQSYKDQVVDWERGPPGLFRWHYLQCVLKRFAHEDYKNLENINFSELPLRMEGDSNDDGTDSEAEWPSKGLDLGRVVENSSKEREECHRAVATWISTSTV